MATTITYLDNNATTRVDDRVAGAVLQAMTGDYGNPSSAHQVGSRAGALLDSARSSVARLIGARDSEIVFTSGGTEADNAAFRGVLAARPTKRHVVVSSVEHSAVVELSEQLEREGVRVSRVRVGHDGALDLEHLADSLTPDTCLISIMLANNETGVILDVRGAAALAKARGALVHTDAVQGAGKIPVDVNDLGVDLLSISGHKIHAPKGVGALCVRRGTPFRPLIVGGHQERDRRGGTQNVPGIVGLAAAAELAARQPAEELSQIRALRDRLEREIAARFEQARPIAAAGPRLPNTSCICFAGVEAEALLLLLSERGICVSSGSACSSGSLEPSHVLKAMGVDPHVAQGQIRFSFSKYNTEADVDAVLAALPDALERLTALAVKTS